MARTVPAAAWSAVMVLLILYPAALAAESVFLKDGSIVEGRVVRENDREVQLALSAGGRSSIPRGEILRTVYHEEYKQKRFIYLMSGEMIEGFIVDEDRETYTYRRDLASARENRVARSKVDFISKRRLEVKEKKEKIETAAVKGAMVRGAVSDTARTESRREGLISRAPRVRIGGGPGPLGGGLGWKDIDGRGWEDQMSVLVDVIIWRERDADGSGFDFYLRGGIKTYSAYPVETQSGQVRLGTFVNAYIGESKVPATDNVIIFDINHYYLSPGARYSRGMYFLGILWQGYVMLHYQYSRVELDTELQVDLGGGVWSEPRGKKYEYTSHGIAGGAGVELGLFRYFGVFAELTYGYSPAMPSDRNLEEFAINFGLTWRTSYL